MEYLICYENWKNTFSVPCGLADEHLLDCGSVQLKALLLVLRHQDAPLSVDQIAQKLSVSSADVKDALNYWVRRGILRTENSDTLETSQPEPHPKAVPSARPANARLTANEIHDITQRQPVIRHLLHETEAILGKTLTSTDISTVICLYDWAGISADVILMVVAYCASLDKRNLRYIEKTALSWQEMGLEDSAAVEAYLDAQSTVRQKEHQVQNAFGIHGRSLSSKEKEHIARWFDEFGFSIEMIRLAYEASVDNTGKVHFSYINKVLQNWHQKGFTTPAQAMSDKSSAHKPEQAGEKKEYSFDLEEFEKLSRYRLPNIQKEGE